MWERQTHGRPVDGQEKSVRVGVGQEDDTVVLRRLVEPRRYRVLLNLVALLIRFHCDVHSFSVSLREQRNAIAEPLEFARFYQRLERAAHRF